MQATIPAVFFSSLALAGCVAIGVGPVATPSGVGVSVDENNHAKIDLPDKSVVIRVGGYGGGFGFVGPIVPIFPLIPGFAGAQKAEDKLNIYIYVKPKGDYTTFDPGAIRVIGDSGQMAPDVILQTERCNEESMAYSVPAGSKTLVKSECFQLKFLKEDPPWPNFTVTGPEFSDIEFQMKRKVGGGLLGSH